MSERGEYRAIRRVLIDGPDYQGLSPEAKLVFLTLKIQLGPAGIDVVNAADFVVCEQTGLPIERVKDALHELEGEGWIARERNVVWIVDGLEHEPSRKLSNANHRQEIEKHLLSLPRLAIVAAFRKRYGMGDGIGNAIPEGMGEHGRTEERKNGRTESAAPDAPPREEPSPTLPAKARRASTPKAGGGSWLEPVAATWEARFGGGTFPWGKAGKALKPLSGRHPPEAIAANLERYLDATPVPFLDLFKFASTFATFSPVCLVDPETGLPTPAGAALLRGGKAA